MRISEAWSGIPNLTKFKHFPTLQNWCDIFIEYSHEKG